MTERIRFLIPIFELLCLETEMGLCLRYVEFRILAKPFWIFVQVYKAFHTPIDRAIHVLVDSVHDHVVAINLSE